MSMKCSGTQSLVSVFGWDLRAALPRWLRPPGPSTPAVPSPENIFMVDYSGVIMLFFFH